MAKGCVSKNFWMGHENPNSNSRLRPEVLFICGSGYFKVSSNSFWAIQHQESNTSVKNSLLLGKLSSIVN